MESAASPFPPVAHARAGPQLARARAEWWDLPLLLLSALLLRLVLSSGAIGSDDITYYGAAAGVADGSWPSSDYNGALRYGFNIPAGLAMLVFGPGLGAAIAWPLLCSLIEIAAIYLFTSAIAGRTAAAMAGLLLAATPLHVSVATRIRYITITPIQIRHQNSCASVIR